MKKSLVYRTKEGDFIRLTELYVQNGPGRQKDIVAWGIVPEYRRVEIFCGPRVTLDEDELDQSDIGRIVPEHRLPNYVCVALAKWRLTGEKTAT